MQALMSVAQRTLVCRHGQSMLRRSSPCSLIVRGQHGGRRAAAAHHARCKPPLQHTGRPDHRARPSRAALQWTKPAAAPRQPSVPSWQSAAAWFTCCEPRGRSRRSIALRARSRPPKANGTSYQKSEHGVRCGMKRRSSRRRGRRASLFTAKNTWSLVLRAQQPGGPRIRCTI